MEIIVDVSGRDAGTASLREFLVSIASALPRAKRNKPVLCVYLAGERTRLASVRRDVEWASEGISIARLTNLLRGCLFNVIACCQLVVRIDESHGTFAVLQLSIKFGATSTAQALGLVERRNCISWALFAVRIEVLPISFVNVSGGALARIL